MNSMTEQLLRIERALSSVLPEKVDSKWLTQVAGQVCTETDPLQADAFLKPGLTLLARGGKRWRPLVTVLICEALGGADRADLLASLTEIPHNGSLIIDDIEDSSLTRRGEAAIHLIYGTDLAVNMGNLMYFLPTIVFENLEFSPAVIAKMMGDWLAVMRRLHLGQGYDILWHGQSALYPDEEAYLRMCRFKTGSLSSLAAMLGARAAQTAKGEGSESSLEDDEDEILVNRLGKVWEDLGTGFQILDDVQNLSTGIPGKDRGDDIVEGKKSYPVILHVERRKNDAAVLDTLFAESAKNAPSGDWSSVDKAISLMMESGAIDDARKKGRVLLESGRSQLLSLLPQHPSRKLLLAMVDIFYEKMT